VEDSVRGVRHATLECPPVWNLSDAQATYAKIQQILQTNRSSSVSKISFGGSNSFQNDFAALGQILQAGDLSQAQSAFSQLQSALQAK
jgi:hypothetical protein